MNTKFKRLNWLRSVLGIILSCLALTCEAKDQKPLPNIILFIGDDHNWWSSGCYGNEVVKTPNLDALAMEGMRFNRAYTTTAMCAPSRAVLYTGLYPHRNGCHMNHGATNLEVKSLPHYFEPLGYRVVLAGKTHIKPQSVYPFEYIAHEEAGAVIEGDKPFLLIIASHEPHGPHKKGDFAPEEVIIPPYLPDLPTLRNTTASYYNDILLLDSEIGEVREILKKSGKKENTLFIYAGDHGNGILSKWSCYEAGLRVPMIASWPGHIQPGVQSDAIINFADFVPTFFEIVGQTPPKPLDGTSFLKIMQGEKSKHREYTYGAHTNQGIISGTAYPIRSVCSERFKYIRNLNPEGQPTSIVTHGFYYTEVTTGLWADWKKEAEQNENTARLIKRYLNRPQEELYDLQNDPWELNNLASNPKFSKIKSDLSSELDRWMEQQNDQGMEAELSVPQMDWDKRKAARKASTKKS